MGSRKLKQWIKEPLNDVTEIALRLDAVEYLTDSVLARNNIREQLKHVYDFERLTDVYKRQVRNSLPVP